VIEGHGFGTISVKQEERREIYHVDP
jgi:hypothetical protein